MTRFISDVKKECGFTLRQLNLGGGLGVRYTENDPYISYSDCIRDIAAVVKSECEKNGIDMPEVRLEPGRSLVAASGITLYTVGSVKEIPGFLNYISVDGGMPDNPRYALYGSRYTFLIANKADMHKNYKATIAGRCCESGDLIQEGVTLPGDIKRGDIIAVLTTGAYNYSMASNYNRVPRPAVVMLNSKQDYIAVQREKIEDIISLDK